jgi:hypothetical protein
MSLRRWWIHNKETLKPEAFASSCLHPCSYLCVKDTGGYTRAVGLQNHVLIMIQNPSAHLRWHQKRCFQGGFRDSNFYEMLQLQMASASTTIRGYNENDKRIPPRDWGNSSRAPSLHRYPLEKGIWCGRKIPANSLLAAASK